MTPCTDCASQVQLKLAAKANDQDANQKAKEYAEEHGADVALYRDEHGRVQFIRADLSGGYPVFAYVVSRQHLQATPQPLD